MIWDAKWRIIIVQSTKGMYPIVSIKRKKEKKKTSWRFPYLEMAASHTNYARPSFLYLNFAGTRKELFRKYHIKL